MTFINIGASAAQNGQISEHLDKNDNARAMKPVIGTMAFSIVCVVAKI